MNRGAEPSEASPTSVRDARNITPFPDENALVITTALMIEGKTLMPAVLKARTNGDDAISLPVPRRGSSAEISKPTTIKDTMYCEHHDYQAASKYRETLHTKKKILQNTRLIALGRFTRGLMTSEPILVVIWMFPIANAALTGVHVRKEGYGGVRRLTKCTPDREETSSATRY